MEEVMEEVMLEDLTAKLNEVRYLDSYLEQYPDNEQALKDYNESLESLHNDYKLSDEEIFSFTNTPIVSMPSSDDDDDD